MSAYYIAPSRFDAFDIDPVDVGRPPVGVEVTVQPRSRKRLIIGIVSGLILVSAIILLIGVLVPKSQPETKGHPNPNKSLTLDEVCQETYGDYCTRAANESCASDSCIESLYELMETSDSLLIVKLTETTRADRKISTNYAVCGEGKLCMDKICVDADHQLYGSNQNANRSNWNDVAFNQAAWNCTKLSDNLFRKLELYRNCATIGCGATAPGAVFSLKLRVCANWRLSCVGKPYRLEYCRECLDNNRKSGLSYYKDKVCKNEQSGKQNNCRFSCGVKLFVVPNGLYCTERRYFSKSKHLFRRSL